MDELLARLRAAVRRATPAEEQPLVETPDFIVDLTEWQFLELLVRNPNKLVTHGQLLSQVWGPQYGGETHYLRVYVARIRRKLEPDPARPRHFLTEPGMGYRFVTPQGAGASFSARMSPPTSPEVDASSLERPGQTIA